MQMCRVADRWRSEFCLSLCFSALVKRIDRERMSLATLVRVMRLLPDSVTEREAWIRKSKAMLIKQIGDVHALLTSPEQLQLFQQLPFHAVRAWAASDDVKVDSENSVAVALTVWAEGEQGSKCTKAQKKELSGLLRVRHLSQRARG